MTVAEKFAEMGITTVMGLTVVFSVLIILWAVIEIMHKVVTYAEGKGGKKAAAETAAAPAAPAEEKTAAPQTDDDELIAVLTAAVAASLNTSTYNLRIKSFKRISKNSSPWNSDSRASAADIL